MIELTITSHRTTHTYTWPAYMVRHLIDALSRVHPYQLLGDAIAFGDIKLTCSDLPQVLHYVYDETEVDAPPAVEFALMRLQPRPQKLKRKRGPVAKEKIIKRRKEKIKRGDYVTINVLAAYLGIKPRDARQALRKMGVEKPLHGWAWSPSEAQIIRTKLSKRFKKVARQTPINKDVATELLENLATDPLQNPPN